MGAVCCTLEYGKAVKENFYHGNLSGEFVHYHDTAGMISVIATALAVATGSLYPLFALLLVAGYLYYGQ